MEEWFPALCICHITRFIISLNIMECWAPPSDPSTNLYIHNSLKHKSHVNNWHAHQDTALQYIYCHSKHYICALLKIQLHFPFNNLKAKRFQSFMLIFRSKSTTTTAEWMWQLTIFKDWLCKSMENSVANVDGPTLDDRCIQNHLCRLLSPHILPNMPLPKPLL